MINREEWQGHQEWERAWWNCANTYGEEYKALLYAQKMGLKTFHDGKSPFNFDGQGKKILDVGGGPCSLLLKFHNVKGKVIDPCRYPDWVYARYDAAGIEYEILPAEEMTETGYNEALIYNVLQHTQDPERVIQRVLNSASIVRLFEWINTGTSQGHPHELKEETLNKWLGGIGKVEELQGDHTCWGKCYYGIFLGKAT